MEQLMTVEDIAHALKKSPKTIYSYVETRRIPSKLIIKLGNTIRMKTSDFEEWLNSNYGREN